MNQQRSINWYFFIFMISGFSGLIYESIWTHYLKLFLGHAAYAQSLVLAIFMGGMAIGAYISSLYSYDWRNLLIKYAFIEGIIGVAAFIFHPVFDRVVNDAYIHLMPGLGSSVLVDIFKWGFSTLLILPQSILLGMTFPLMCAGLVRQYNIGSGKTVASLYFVNSLGGAIGVLASGFLLIKLFGLQGTIAIAGALNIFVAFSVYLLCRGQLELSTPKIIHHKDVSVSGKKPILILVSVAFFTGFSSLVYELGWIRMLSMVLGSTTHAFELMLSAFILGLALGGLWIRKRIESLDNPILFLAIIQVIMALFALGTLYIYTGSFQLMNWMVHNISKTESGYVLFNFSSHLIAFCIMLPTTFCAGMTLPLLTFNLLKQGYGEKSIGVVYSANTLGAIIGVFSTIHLLMPSMGLKGVIVSGSAIDVAAGIGLLLWIFRSINRNLIYVLSTVSIFCLVITASFFDLNLLNMASGVFRETGFLVEGKDEVIYYKDGKTASASLTADRDGIVSIRTNGKVDAGINMAADKDYASDEATMTLAGTLPLLMNPKAKTAANIGLGSGLTSHALLSSLTLEKVDTIEIEPAMIEAARGFLPRNENVYQDPRSHIIVDDAKSFFSTYGNRYDIIVSEPSNPWVSGVAGLFTKEFYQLVKRQLTDQGLFVQWLQLYEIDLPMVSSVIRAINENFQSYVLYASNNADMLIIMSKSGEIPQLSGELFEKNLKFRQLMSRIQIHNLQDLSFRFLGDRAVITPFINSFNVPANSDYTPYLDQHAGHARFMNATANRLVQLVMEPIPIVETLSKINREYKKTTVSPTLNYKVTEIIQKAILYRDAIGYFNHFDYRLDPNDEQKIMEFNQLFFQCAIPKHGDKIYVLFDVMLKTAGYLSEQEFKLIWKRIDEQECTIQWNAREQIWLKFFKAVTLRDSMEIIKFANQLVKENWDITPARKKFLLAVTSLAYLNVNDNASARIFWQKNIDDTQAAKLQDSTIFQMLYAHIYQ